MPNVLAFARKNLTRPPSECSFIVDALDRSQAVIEFKMDGTIINANKNFLDAVGYSLDEIFDKNHSIFVDPLERNDAYRDFWARLNRGEFQSGQYRRIGKGGREIWIEASYNPILGKNGRPVKVIKFATEITRDKLRNADYEGQLAAVNKSQAVIEFKLDGTILKANENFLHTLGYTSDEIAGQHHSMFVDPKEAALPAYREFWASLARGEFKAAQYRRIGKGGKEVWIEASYNPIFDMNGKPFKVVKYATDITSQIDLLKNVKNLMDQNMEEIDQAVQMVSHQSGSASSSSSQTTSNVQAVASGAEELHASVQEISQNMSKSKTEADDAYEKVLSAVHETEKLETAAQAMNGIVELIQNIANQVNLLSLNATIEAARAGEAGKGFAVVANEVKNLAGQASDATSQISTEINGVQTVVKNVVESLDTIRNSIDKVRNYVTSVAGAVEEQSAVAQDMSSNMQIASQAVSDVTESISQIVAAAEQVNAAVLHAKEAASSLAK
ncbi:MAG: chemotaxis protein [Micavibrio aeruginosavorus]|uniref:Chemotaxis protein n=1 Tax=Micavibrio aeruginosavorus TaxID=349221 RepID=A0A2W5FLM0_9BACT|nr:MAG: chemotaxis protein [Micavibrio aeruginosavorus]